MLRSGQRVHVVETGEGPPALLLHGSNTSSLGFLPLFAHLHGVRVVAVDRTGLGLSDPGPVPRGRFRAAAVEFVDGVLDELGIAASALVGNSMGGVWSLWYALARPERVRAVVLVGSVPLLPGTRCPGPLRLSVTPLVGDLLSRYVKVSPKMLVRLLSSVGEGDTIVMYPDLIGAIVAGGNDPIAATTTLAELRALIHPFGFRRSMRFQVEELRSVRAPTLVIWGDNDSVGSVAVARSATAMFPDARLEVLPAGHVPYFGHPERVADLVGGFVQAHGRG
jgi:pimeloyl-ACP methyl ester carboxylesterase